MGRTSDAKERLMEAVQGLIWTGSYGTTTIDQICEKAGVKKGSFYYFFESKADLALAAIEVDWNARREVLDHIFSPSKPPMDRIRDFLADGMKTQEAMKAQCGYVLGCPLCTLGAEVCTMEQALRAKIQEVMEGVRKYLESAVRDAKAAGIAHVADEILATQTLWAYYEGLLTQARITNDLGVLRGGWDGTLTLLGVRTEAMATV